MAKGENRSSKRRFGGKSSHYGPTPRRGPPAIFVTCESGREKKCQREALELIHHYYYASRPSLQHGKKSEDEGTSPLESLTKGETMENRPLSLEEEVSMLRRGAAAEEVLSYEPDSKRPRNGSENASSKQIKSSMKSPFSIYDTGLRGMVCILCTLPDCEMVPYTDILAEIRASKETDSKDTEHVATGSNEAKKTDEDDNGTVAKDRIVSQTSKESNENTSLNPLTGPTLWDPVETVKCIFQDAKKCSKEGSNDTNGSPNDEEKKDEQEELEQKEASVPKELLASPPPGSRFILRILPMQATCYASVEEIKAVSTLLLKRFLPKFQTILSKGSKEITFKLEIKRRLCAHLKSMQVIEAITPLVLGGVEEVPGYTFKVNLSNPDFSVRIEMCKGLCGISILPREDWYKNFNLAELINPS